MGVTACAKSKTQYDRTVQEHKVVVFPCKNHIGSEAVHMGIETLVNLRLL